ncbi:MAG: PspA/IM30 family protein [Nitrosomonas sp.]|nr:PspA/IM30 family protein [Nitrosomonas sp.]
MSILKRLSTTLISRIDRVVTEIENHDAVIQAALNEMNGKMARAKIALNQACRERDRIKAELETQHNNIQRWQERAIICAKTDESTGESKALECLRRSHKSRERVAVLKKSLDEYARSIEKMTGNIQSSAQRLNEMKQRLTLMRAKQATSKTDAAVHSPCGDAESIVEDTFNRWEMHLNHDDIPLDCATDDVDELEYEFITQEQQNDLHNELTALLTREKQQ